MEMHAQLTRGRPQGGGTLRRQRVTLIQSQRGTLRRQRVTLIQSQRGTLYRRKPLSHCQTKSLRVWSKALTWPALSHHQS